MSDSVRPHRQQPTRLPHTWDSPGKSTGVGCHFLLQCMKVKSESEVTQSCLTLSDPMDCSLPGSFIHGIFQGRQEYWSGVPLPSPSGFPYFLQFKSEFGNKEFMIWATVSSPSCFCWLYRTSPSLAAKNIINLIWYWPSGDVHVWSLLLCCWKRVFAMTNSLSWQNSISLCLLHSELQGQICLLHQVFLHFLLLNSSPLECKKHLFECLF